MSRLSVFCCFNAFIAFQLAALAVASLSKLAASAEFA